MSTGLGSSGGGLLMSLKGMAAQLVLVFDASRVRVAVLVATVVDFGWDCLSIAKSCAVVLRQKKTASEVELVVTPIAQSYQCVISNATLASLILSR